MSEEKVWGIRLDIRVLNHEGNVADCASIAGLAALAHFRRPDISLDGDKVTVSFINLISIKWPTGKSIFKEVLFLQKIHRISD